MMNKDMNSNIRHSSFSNHQFRLIAHRGNSSAAPENTLPAFRSALDAGIVTVECDVQQTADDELVVFHDDTLERVTDAKERLTATKRRVRDCTLADLRKLDAGRWFSPAYARTSIPTLGETLKAVLPRGHLMVERKSGQPQRFLAVFDAFGDLSKLTLHAFDWPFLAEVHRLRPTVMLGALGKKEVPPQAPSEARSLGASILGWEAKYLNVENISAAHRVGLQVWAWTVDDVGEAQRLLAASVDGLISNIPAVLRAAIGS
jgi:glycerophosphoryl diester phosphodiesterase